MKFYANPYNTSVTGFYFESIDELQSKSSALKDECRLPVEEFEIEVIDGTREEMELADVFGINQSNIQNFVKFIETSDEDIWPTVYLLFYLQRVADFYEALSFASDYDVREGKLIDVAADVFDEIYNPSDELKVYINYEKFANDLDQSGDAVEFEFGWKTYCCVNANQ